MKVATFELWRPPLALLWWRGSHKWDLLPFYSSAFPNAMALYQPKAVGVPGWVGPRTKHFTLLLPACTVLRDLTQNWHRPVHADHLPAWEVTESNKKGVTRWSPTAWNPDKLSLLPHHRKGSLLNRVRNWQGRTVVCQQCLPFYWTHWDSFENLEQFWKTVALMGLLDTTRLHAVPGKSTYSSS